ncbi:hypothetical protein K438DRAFT_1782747 [Mycena galopus ATCC 62051]|nr:hypothetical protein K438DRAFT_1782747 [Mycena galopus ATCC 62051]
MFDVAVDIPAGEIKGLQGIHQHFHQLSGIQLTIPFSLLKMQLTGSRLMVINSISSTMILAYVSDLGIPTKLHPRKSDHTTPIRSVGTACADLVPIKAVGYPVALGKPSRTFVHQKARDVANNVDLQVKMCRIGTRDCTRSASERPSGKIERRLRSAWAPDVIRELDSESMMEISRLDFSQVEASSDCCIHCQPPGDQKNQKLGSEVFGTDQSSRGTNGDGRPLGFYVCVTVIWPL